MKLSSKRMTKALTKVGAFVVRKPPKTGFLALRLNYNNNRYKCLIITGEMLATSCFSSKKKVSRSLHQCGDSKAALFLVYFYTV